MTVYDWLASLWRTVVPMIVGVLAVQAARIGVEIDEAAAASALTAGFATVYYGLVRTAEQHLGTGWGWLLGLARPPHYDPGGVDGELAALARDRR